MPAVDDVVATWHDAEGSGREPLLVLEPLSAYLSERGLADDWPRVELIGDGLSNATFALSFDHGPQLVLRRPPRGPLPSSAHDVLREAHIITRLAHSDVPVPSVIDVCADPDVIGAPFYLSSRLHGKVPVTTLPQALQRPKERRRYGQRLAETLAGIHRVDLEAIGLDQLGGSAGYLERQISRHLRLWEHNRTRELAAVAWLADWLSANMPPQRETTLVHGDFHPANVMIAEDRPARVAAVLDWELATRGDPLADVGYLCALWRESGDPPEHPLERGPVTRGEGSLTRGELLSHYAAVSGRSVDDHGWYEVLALWRAAIFTEGNFRRAALGATDTPFLRNAGEHAQRLARLALDRVRELEE